MALKGYLKTSTSAQWKQTRSLRLFLPAPPTFGLQYRCQPLAELFQRLTSFGSFDHGGIDIADHIHAGGFGHGEGGGVRIIQHILPVPRYVDAFLLQIGHGGFKPKEKAEFSSTYQTTEIRQVLDGREVLYYNALRNEYRVDGVDVEETYRRNIGA